MNWLSKHVPTLILILTLLCGLIVQWTRMEISVSDLRTLKAEYNSHKNDTRLHVDPERDERRWQELLDRLSRIEDKIDGR